MDDSTTFTILISLALLSLWLVPAVQERLEARGERRAFEAKGAPLRGATVETREVAPVEPPDPDAFEDDDPLPREFYEVDLTVAPAAGAPRWWRPLDLDVFDPDEDREALGGESADMVALYELDVWVDGEWVPEEELGEEFAVDGPARLLLLVGAHESVRRFAFSYFFEEFGDVALTDDADDADDADARGSDP